MIYGRATHGLTLSWRMPLLYRNQSNQWAGFYLIETSNMKVLKKLLWKRIRNNIFKSKIYLKFGSLRNCFVFQIWKFHFYIFQKEQGTKKLCRSYLRMLINALFDRAFSFGIYSPLLKIMLFDEDLQIVKILYLT